MSVNPTTNELSDDRRIGVSWWTVGIFAAILAAADGFWATSVRGAVGYIENVQEPFHDWLLYLAVMGPLFAAIVAGALWLAQRLVGGRHGLVRIAAASVLVVAATTLLAVGQIALTAVYDYHSQQAQVALIHHIHSGTATGVTYGSTRASRSRRSRPAPASATSRGRPSPCITARSDSPRCSCSSRTPCSCCGRWRSAAAASGCGAGWCYPGAGDRSARHGRARSDFLPAVAGPAAPPRPGRSLWWSVRARWLAALSVARRRTGVGSRCRRSRTLRRRSP